MGVEMYVFIVPGYVSLQLLLQQAGCEQRYLTMRLLGSWHNLCSAPAAAAVHTCL
jgi:hypothetical protein